ncbi:hypothetical protein W02_05040 [Nitrospira sp. KM1]|uniref:MoaD/ThiS family protein n=1 Tax=Nitrospira sp. KM1 TaxID=1936990 RepID=UPI0013A71F0F|nr:hypothetical protein [Nitrospira sp. KM1]BCA53364.1 hypothetical protein W02_05040 [Nitrospira sp. KM1]
MIKVLIFGLTLRTALDEHELDIETSLPTTVKKLIEDHPPRLGALLPFVIDREVVIIVNRRIGSEHSIVKDGDVVKLSYHSQNQAHDGVRDIPT